MAASARRRGLTLLELLVVLVILTALGTMLIPSLSWMGERSQRLATQENLRRIREMIVNEYEVDMGDLPRPRADQSTASVTRPLHPQLVYLFVHPDTHDNGIIADDFTQPPGTTLLSGRIWNGPYVQHSGMEYYATDTDASLTTGTNFTTRYGVGDLASRVGDPTITDAWGHPIVIQEPSADADFDGALDTDFDGDSDQDADDVAFGRLHARLVSAGRDGILQTDPQVLMPTLAERGDDEVIFLYRHDEHGDAMLDLEP
ncbi:MAG: prepilin-type N-terminal cleavage/methylation domain-containing protein [Planctomycetota bacterium]